MTRYAHIVLPDGKTQVNDMSRTGLIILTLFSMGSMRMPYAHAAEDASSYTWVIKLPECPNGYYAVTMPDMACAAPYPNGGLTICEAWKTKPCVNIPNGKLIQNK
jgi:hypothetical protein